MFFIGSAEGLSLWNAVDEENVVRLPMFFILSYHTLSKFTQLTHACRDDSKLKFDFLAVLSDSLTGERPRIVENTEKCVDDAMLELKNHVDARQHKYRKTFFSFLSIQDRPITLNINLRRSLGAFLD